MRAERGWERSCLSSENELTMCRVLQQKQAPAKRSPRATLLVISLLLPHDVLDHRLVYHLLLEQSTTTGLYQLQVCDSLELPRPTDDGVDRRTRLGAHARCALFQTCEHSADSPATIPLIAMKFALERSAGCNLGRDPCNLGLDCLEEA